jgi:hypothetical protein
MDSLCLPRRRIPLLVLFIFSHFPMAGCTDESKTSGTMVQESAEAKAFRKTKSETYKGGPPKKKATAAVKKA